MNATKKLLAVSTFLSALTVGVLGVSVAFAQNTVTSPINSVGGVQSLLCSVISWFIWVVILVAVLMVVYAAYTYATAGDDTEKVATGRKTITYAAVGIVVALCAAGIPAIVESVFGNSGTFPVIACLNGGGTTPPSSTTQ